MDKNNNILNRILDLITIDEQINLLSKPIILKKRDKIIFTNFDMVETYIFDKNAYVYHIEERLKFKKIFLINREILILLDNEYNLFITYNYDDNTKLLSPIKIDL